MKAKDLCEIELVGGDVANFVSALGSNIVPINPPVPHALTRPDGERTGAFLIDWDQLTDEQRDGLAKLVSETHDISVVEALENIPSQPVSIDAQYCLMRRVTREQIELTRKGFLENYKRKHPSADHLNELAMTAREIVCFLLGHDWWVRNVWQEMGQAARRMEYLRLDMKTERAPTESVDRLISLADSLFAVQHSKGFDFKLDELRAMSPEQPNVVLEDIAIELEVAKLLVRSGHEIEFVEPKKDQRGQDFDLRLTLRTGENANVEIKCKREETPVNAKSLRNSLRDLRGQLPKGIAGVGFVRLPYEWVADDGFADEVRSVLEGFFRNTGRVNAVVFVWEEWLDLGDGALARAQKFRIELNPNPACPLDALATILPALIEFHVDDAAHFRLSFGDFGPHSHG